ncbi:hypothetical protein HTZ84_22110 [Haloterrigena sp. SYSU A558-1]|uniref:Halobacterial output domain-containing protein n=1 Tax=Haloterrigena gelatinilytica TaxID=2741724 RepID=A0ABX2LFD3_9EURY|nr:hypothetical protein [Haloterrigena gelatinilytica]NUC74962.1 hypothetical protein [Haloterrigena gelatinilytica]
MADPEDIVSDGEDISLRRDPALGRALVAEYEYVDSEQDAIRRAMRERVRWGQQGILPEQLLQAFKRFVESSTGEFGDAGGEALVFRCAETGAELTLEDDAESAEVSLSLAEDDDRTEQ